MEKIQTKHKTSQIKALLALTKASITASFRNPNALFFSFFFPLIFITIFGLLGQGDQVFTVAVRENSVKEGLLYETLEKVEVLKLDDSKTNEEIDTELKKGQLAVAITIEEAGEIYAGQGQMITRYSIHVEKSSAAPENSQTIVMILNNIINKFNSPEGIPSTDMIELSESTVEGREFKQIDFVLPGQLAFALLSNALFGISITFVNLRKQLIIKRLFATPVNRWCILLSESLSKFVIAILQSLLIITVGHFAFGYVLINGVVTVLSMLVLSTIGIIVFLGFGLFVASIGRDPETVAPIANLIMMPQLFLSGAFFPIEYFPKYIQPIAKILPMTYLNEAFRKVAFEGSSIVETLPNIGALVIWGIIMYVLVSRLFKWE